jgi:selenocysteine-specific elongation factor
VSVVVGTAGHIDHGKTTLLRALTGIDADRLPEERARGMTIDVGYAHLALPDGSELDFVDVPGHDRLVGNMLVGAGEVDAAVLVVAADDGPRAQTLEHLELLDALGIAAGLVVVTKIDVVAPERADQVAAEVRTLLAATTLRDAPVLAVSATSGEGIEALRTALVALRDRVEAGSVGKAEAACRLAIDRVFTVRGRGTVVTGTLRGGSVERGSLLRIVPGGGDHRVRVREVQVHGRAVERAGPGRVALNVAAGGATEQLARGVVLTTDPAVIESDRLLVALEPVGGAGGGRVRAGDSAPAVQLPADRTRVAIHAGTARVAAFVGRSGRDAVALDEGHATAVLRLDRPIAIAPGDRLVVRRESPAGTLAGGRVLDPDPPRGTARRRTTPERLRALANAPAGSASWRRARLDLHGALAGPPPVAAADLANAIDERLAAEVGFRPGLGLAELVRTGTAELRRRVGSLGATGPGAAGPAERIVAERIAGLVAAGRLARDGNRVRPAGTAAAEASPELVAAMDRLVAALATATPPALAAAARAAGCPTEGVRRLEEANRIVRVEDDLAWEAGTWRELAAQALALAAVRPLTPATLRDAIGSSRKYVMALLEDLDRRAILRRTPDGHVPGVRAGQLGGATDAAARAEPERVR